MSQNKLYLIAGLGNPGKSYQNTRHNAGFRVIDLISEAYSIVLNKKKYDTVFGSGKINGADVILAKPMGYMNRSGPPIQKLVNFYKIASESLLVIHDDIDLAPGRIKIKMKGGHGGHKGIKSLVSAFGGGDFMRIRIGVGRPLPKYDLISHVLGSFSLYETELMDKVMLTARDAAVLIVSNGINEAMNKFNINIAA